jgi:hypothetical protein
MYQGSCLCGRVKYEVHGALGPIGLCHCSRCRKANGSAFLAAAQIKPDEFKLISGHDSLGDFESSAGVHRIFCTRCGSPLYSRRPGPPEILRLRIGTLDTPLQTKVQSHIFFADKASWFEFQDAAPKFAQRPA